MKKRLYRSKSRGQSIPLIAAIIVALFGMAALSLDVGSAYARQRELVRATNSAALEGLDTAITNGTTIEQVRERIANALRSNGIPITEGTLDIGQFGYKAIFLDAAGQPITSCPVATCSDATFNSVRGNIVYLTIESQGSVETTFARVVGSESLAINTVAHARQGLCPSGIYPLAVDMNLLDTTNGRFDPADGMYSDDFFVEPKTYRRIYLRDTPTAGNFGFVRWNADSNSGNSAQSLAQAFTGDGTVSQSYKEAAWPMDNQGNSAVDKQPPPGYPDSYPPQPGKISIGDWVAADPGISGFNGNGNNNNNSDLTNALDQHVRNRTILNLPIYEYASGTGANSTFYISDVGAFYLKAYGKDGGQFYVDLVYLGQGSRCVDLASVPDQPSQLLSMAGNISLYPSFAQYGGQTERPIQFIILLDVSGSMSWSFDGRGNIGGTIVQCQGPSTTGAPIGNCAGGGSATAFPDTNQRRIKIASDLLQQFVASLRPRDQVRFVTFTGSFGAGNDNPIADDQALEDLTYDALNGWSNNTTQINNVIESVTRGASGNYTTEGATPSAVGLARVRQILASAPAVDPETGLGYKRAVIFLTDGVANVSRGGYEYVCPDGASDDLECQSGPYDGFNPTRYKPVSAMHQERELLNNMLITEDTNTNGNGIYAIALGPDAVSDSLLPFEPRLFRADDPTAMERALNTIRNEVQEAVCADGGAALVEPKRTFTSSNLPDYSILAATGNPEYSSIVAPVVGKVTLSTGNTRLTGDITWNPSTGTMSYLIENIPAGSYNVSYWMAYKAAEDNSTRIYQHARPFGNSSIPTNTQSVTLAPNASVFNTVDQPIVLDLDPTIDICQTTVGG
ncbi:MAG: VWA domain-containing protein [Roseiflexaceae bacterium]